MTGLFRKTCLNALSRAGTAFAEFCARIGAKRNKVFIHPVWYTIYASVPAVLLIILSLLIGALSVKIPKCLDISAADLETSAVFIEIICNGGHQVGFLYAPNWALLFVTVFPAIFIYPLV